MKNIILLTSIYCFVGSVAFGLMSWDTTQVTQRVDPLARTAEAVFGFENIGDAAVTITDVKSSCGCTTAKLDKRTYAPGERGEIKAALDIGNRQGLQRKSIRVTTSDGETTELQMRTLIPVLLEMTPRFVFWKQGERTPLPKTVEVRLGDESAEITGVEVRGGPFSTELAADSEQVGVHTLTVFPHNLNESAQGTIAIRLKVANAPPKIYYVYAHIK